MPFIVLTTGAVEEVEALVEGFISLVLVLFENELVKLFVVFVLFATFYKLI